MKSKSTKRNSKPKTKRGFMVINLVAMPGGYSVIQGTEIFNRNAAPPQIAPIPIASNNSGQPTLNSFTTPAIKQSKMVTKQNNLLFLKAPTDFSPLYQQHKTQTFRIPPGTKSFASWLDLGMVHDVELNQLKLWFFQDNSTTVQSVDKVDVLSPQFQQMLQKYKKHRNQIVKVYCERYAQNQQFLSASLVRKYISDDAFWLMRLHMFLTSQGIINNTKINLLNQNFSIHDIFKIDFEKNQLQTINSSNKEKKFEQSFQKSAQCNFTQNQLLKEITKTIRPYCDFCGIKCEIVWFQHSRSVDPKQISMIMKNVNSKNPPLSEKQYEIILCAKCYCNGSFPLLLTHHDFKKMTVNDKIQPGKTKKKKEKKKKRKQKKRRLKEKEKQMLDQYQQQKQENDHEQRNKQEDEEIDASIVKKTQNSPKNSIKNQDINQISNLKNNINASAQKNQQNAELNNGTQAQNKNQIIVQILSNMEKQRKWTFQETLKLLQLIEKQGQNWNQIHKGMIKNGYCYDCTPEKLIQYFVSLPKRNLLKLNEQYENSEFTQANGSNLHKSTFLNKIAEKKINLAYQLKKQNIHTIMKSEQRTQWKQNLNQFIKLMMKKIETRIVAIQKIEATSKQVLRNSQKSQKQIVD